MAGMLHPTSQVGKLKPKEGKWLGKFGARFSAEVLQLLVQSSVCCRALWVLCGVS